MAQAAGQETGQEAGQGQGSAGAAAETGKRPAPDWFIEGIYAMSMAEALARGCRSVGLNGFAAAAHASTLTRRLEEAGFDPADPVPQMIDPDGRTQAEHDAFLARHPGIDTSGADICAVARSEMDAETVIGLLLSEEPGQ